MDDRGGNFGEDKETDKLKDTLEEEEGGEMGSRR